MVEVTFRPFTDDEYGPWRAAQIRTFAEVLAGVEGRPAEHLWGSSAQRFDRLMPDGLATERTWVLHVLDEDGADVGLLWLGPHPQRADAAWVCNIEIAQRHRGRGLGRATMLAAERIVRDAGLAVLGLNVFGDNATARGLYESMGYRVDALQMSKPVRDPS